MKIVGQPFRITFSLGLDITGYQTAQIGYLKPGSTTKAYWTATIDNVLTGAGHVDVTGTQNDTVGTWRAWPKIAGANGTIYPVLAVARSFRILAEGEAYSEN